MPPTKCPTCGVTWEGGEIPEALMASGNYDRQEAERVAAHYGWTKTNRLKFSINVVGIETPDYDGVSFWLCQKCNTRIGRFSWNKTGHYDAEQCE